MTDREHVAQEDLALHALQTLSPEESAAIRLHLAECALCRSELANLSGDLALVALSSEQHPVPEGARQRFIDRISAAPEGTQQAGAQQALHSPATPITTGRPASRSAIWIPWAAVAALVIVAISLGAKVSSLNQDLRNESGLVAQLAAAASHAQEVVEVLTASSAQRVVLTPAKTPVVPTGRAVYLADRGGLIFQANNLDPLPGDKTYELWVIPANDKAPVPAGLFRPDSTGSASLVLPPLPMNLAAKAFAVTIEKAEGSTTPTAPIILSGAASTSGG
jgi:anti-sigma-K factor RskA